MTIGIGDVAAKGKTVTVCYTSTLSDGTVFDPSHERREPLSFLLGAGKVIPGWEQGVSGMKVGGRRRIVIPPNLAYGAKGAESIPANATIILDIELVAVQ